MRDENTPNLALAAFTVTATDDRIEISENDGRLVHVAFTHPTNAEAAATALRVILSRAFQRGAVEYPADPSGNIKDRSSQSTASGAVVRLDGDQIILTTGTLTEAVLTHRSNPAQAAETLRILIGRAYAMGEQSRP